MRMRMTFRWLFILTILVNCTGDPTGEQNDPPPGSSPPLGPRNRIPAPPTIGETCLDGASSIEKASSSKDRYKFDSPKKAVDASGVDWQGSGDEASLVRTEGSDQACFSGGKNGSILDGGFPLDASYECNSTHCPSGGCPNPCYAFHSAAGLGPDVTNVHIIEDLQIRNTGDGISMQTADSRDVIVRRVYMLNIHDDAFESDFANGGFVIDDCLVEHAYVGFAMRLRSSASGDQTNKVWAIRNNLIRLSSNINNYKQKPGHGNLYKLDGGSNEPIFVLIGNTFVLGPVMGGKKVMPPVSQTQECSNNTILWLGSQSDWDSYMGSSDHPDGGNNGERLAALNSKFGSTCMNIVIKPSGTSVDGFLDQQGWNSKVQQWKNSHVAGTIQ